MSNIAPIINSRQKEIMSRLLKTHGKCTIADLSEKTFLNPDVIRNNLDIIRTWFECFNVEFTIKPNYGIEILASQQVKDDLLNKLNCLGDTEVCLSHKQRVRIILLYLLTSRVPITSGNIVEIENFSRSTLFRDFKEIRIWLNNYQIELLSKTSEGFWISGSEVSRRFALMSLIYEEIGRESWLALSSFLIEENKIPELPITNCFKRYIRTLPLVFSSHIVQYIEVNMSSIKSSTLRSDLLVYLAVAINALVNDRKIENFKDNNKNVGEQYYLMAKVLCFMIDKEYHLNIRDEELFIIATLLRSSLSNQIIHQNTLNQENNFQINQVCTELASEIIRIASLRLHPMLKIDELLLNELRVHFENVFFHLKYNIPFRTENVEIIQNRYRDIFNIVANSCKIIEKKIGNRVPLQETCNITMYILSALERLHCEDNSSPTICIINEGSRSKSSLLKSRLGVEFPALSRVRIIDTSENLSKYNIESDLILSTVPLSNIKIEKIQVSPFLDSRDIKQIEKWLKIKSDLRKQKLGRVVKENYSLLDLLIRPHITFSTKAKSWQDMVSKASLPLLKSGCIQSHYIDKIKDLIKEYGFYMTIAPGVLLLHARPTDGVNKLGLSLLKLEIPFHINNKTNSDIDLAFVLSAVNKKSHINVLNELIGLTQDSALMQKIRQTDQPSELLNLLWQSLPNLDKSTKQ